MNKIGFIQGRLSDVSQKGVIQEFPWDSWENEFPEASKIGINKIEWTLDQKDLHKNPLLTKNGQSQINSLCKLHSISIPSLTGDCFMQYPFWKSSGKYQKKLKQDFVSIVKACSIMKIGIIVVPLVDNGRIENVNQKDELLSILKEFDPMLKKFNIMLAFESDYDPYELKSFISNLCPKTFGINYDIGNSASLGYDPNDEFKEYADRVINVHVKDRLLGSTTVPLGQGNANFNSVFRNLTEMKYRGNYILQTARDYKGNHANVLKKYANLTENWIKDNES